MALDPLLEELELPPKKSKKKLIIVSLLVVGLLGAGGAAANYYLHSLPAKPKAAVNEEKPKTAPKPPLFINLETFTLNLQQEQPEEQYLQVDITLKVHDEVEAGIIKQHMPQVRDRLLMLLTSKRASEINSIEGKKLLSSEIIKSINEPFSPGATAQQVDGVFFTSFVIQ